MALGQFASGHLFAAFGAAGYLLMSVSSALALAAALLLDRMWTGRGLEVGRG
jgi:hypothetical protein